MMGGRLAPPVPGIKRRTVWLLTRNCSGLLSVVPRKLVPDTVPAFPVIVHIVPLASTTSTPHAHAPLTRLTICVSGQVRLPSVSLSTPSAKPAGTPVKPLHAIVALVSLKV